MPQRWEQVTVDGSPMGCFLAAPEGAGHAFLNRFRPTYRPEAAADAWRKCLDFLAQHLRRGA